MTARCEIARVHAWVREWSPYRGRFIRRRRVIGFRYWYNGRQVSRHGAPVKPTPWWGRALDAIGWPHFLHGRMGVI